MVAVQAGSSAKIAFVAGLGVSVKVRTEIAPGIAIVLPKYSISAAQIKARTASDLEAALVLRMGAIASFALEIHEPTGGKALAVKVWNSLWLFHLISLAAKKACAMLFSFSDDAKGPYQIVNPNVVIRPREDIGLLTDVEIQWLKQNFGKFDGLLKDERFTRPLLAFTNAQYLAYAHVRMMLIWSGIEAILDVDGELNRRLALNSALLLPGTHGEKSALFARVKKAYGYRSKVVHGAKLDAAVLAQEDKYASDLLCRLLARCVELGRVPDRKEFDEAALIGTLS